MDFGAIYHRSALSDCYAMDADTVVINLRTGKDVTAVDLIHDDPFAGGAMGFATWDGKPEKMELAWELKHQNIWSVTLHPRFKREQYYFSITAGDETLLMFEDGFYTPEEAKKPGRLRQYYRFPWVNASDILTPPAWVNDTVWYQIMPDRFCRGDMAPKRVPTRDWKDCETIAHFDFYGGDLKGIRQKLPYLKELGVTGIYTTPFFLSNSNHKYNTFSYDLIDPDFGTEEDMIALVEDAHKLGIRVMMDAVFNHCGTEFAPWQDVVKNGPASPYWDWFFVFQWPFSEKERHTADGKYFSFAFTAYMPKLNTNNPEVMDYFLQRCRHWAEKWHIDGIRFDVANEVSHSFLKYLNAGLKKDYPDLFLLGEIWHDSNQWLQGDEYDSVMNYPFMQSLNNFHLDKQDAKELMYSMNRCYTLYPKQANPALFNFLDTHDTLRALTRCGGKDALYQQLTVLMTMPGSACIYYGTEIGMEAATDLEARRPMPWHLVDTEDCQVEFRQVQALIALRKAYPQLRRGDIRWELSDEHPKLVRYTRILEDHTPISVWLNAGDTAVEVEAGNVLFSRHWEGATLLPGGVVIAEG